MKLNESYEFYCFGFTLRSKGLKRLATHLLASGGSSYLPPIIKIYVKQQTEHSIYMKIKLVQDFMKKCKITNIGYQTLGKVFGSGGFMNLKKYSPLSDYVP